VGIREDFSEYRDGNDLMTPNPVPPEVRQGSDNGCLFLSEYYIILARSNQLTDFDKIAYDTIIRSCINPNGTLSRVPVGQDDGLESVDDYYAVLNACMHLGNTGIPRTFLGSLIRHGGFMNNTSTFTWNSFLARQPQLIAAMVAASFPSWKNPFHILLRCLALPLFVYAAIIIATSCIGTDPNSADPRRLSWHLMTNLRRVSALMVFASLFWYHRLYSVYGSSGMRNVAGIYYKPVGLNNNPYSKYWVN
jgi:hypothetical protein